MDVPQAWDTFYNRKLAVHASSHPTVAQVRAEQLKPDDLMDCLRQMVKPETVVAYSSELTKRKGDYAESKQLKSLSLWRGPPCLIIALKRFRVTESGARYKLNNLVQFPTRDLDLEEFRSGGGGGGGGAEEGEEKEGPGSAPTCVQYDLTAVVNHSGTLSGGHYTAYAKQYQTGKWLCFNDDTVFEGSEENVVSAQAYLLFYTRKDMHDATLSDLFSRQEGAEAADVQSVVRAPWTPPSAGRNNSRRRYGCPVM